ncbi:MAG: hypothetical protein LC792_29915 [Actinobacteria bacterium]|nr:hypothetical protein [Actinomycetota bacterium]
MADQLLPAAELVRGFKTKLNVLHCSRAWLWLERQLGRDPLRTYLLSPVERADYRSYGENRASSPECHCRPSSLLYWELSKADTSRCPVHNDGQDA